MIFGVEEIVIETVAYYDQNPGTDGACNGKKVERS